MSFLRKLGGAGASAPETGPIATSGEWESGQFARASGDGVEVRFHDAAEARLATEQLRELMRQWQNERLELAAAYADEVAKHAAIINEMKARQASIEQVIRRIDAAIAKVEAYARRGP